MIIVVYPNNTLSFRNSETDERETAIYTYEEVKSIFGFQDIRPGTEETAKHLFSGDHECIVFNNRLSSGKIDTRGRKVEKVRIRYSEERKTKMVNGVKTMYERMKGDFD